MCTFAYINNEKTEIMKKQNYFITFLNKEKGFQKDTVYFNSYNEAIQWGLLNLEKFNSDMIMINL